MTLAVIDEHKDYILLQQINLESYIFNIINMLHRYMYFASNKPYGTTSVHLYIPDFVVSA